MADILDHLHEARRLDAQERRDREQRWTLPTTAEGWGSLALRLAWRVQPELRCIGPVDRGRPPCTACLATAVVRADAQRFLRNGSAEDMPQHRADAHLRAPCLDHDAMPCPDTSCTGAIGDGSHDGAPPTCDACGRTWVRHTVCETVHVQDEPCPTCSAQREAG